MGTLPAWTRDATSERIETCYTIAGSTAARVVVIVSRRSSRARVQRACVAHWYDKRIGLRNTCVQEFVAPTSAEAESLAKAWLMGEVMRGAYTEDAVASQVDLAVLSTAIVVLGGSKVP